MKLLKAFIILEIILLAFYIIGSSVESGLLYATVIIYIYLFASEDKSYKRRK